MVSCCGRERHSAFCPACGSKLGQFGPLHELLKYCQRRHAEYRRLATHAAEHVASLAGKNDVQVGSVRDGLLERAKRKQSRRESDASIWAARHDALAELMKTADDLPPQAKAAASNYTLLKNLSPELVGAGWVTAPDRDVDEALRRGLDTRPRAEL